MQTHNNSNKMQLHGTQFDRLGVTHVAGVVECMAAGTVSLAHDSGGPKLDIVVPHNNAPTGFLASSEREYAQAMDAIFTMPEEERRRLRENARESVGRFSEQEFEMSFLGNMAPFFTENFGQGDAG